VIGSSLVCAGISFIARRNKHKRLRTKGLWCSVLNIVLDTVTLQVLGQRVFPAIIPEAEVARFSPMSVFSMELHIRVR
jgi:hypothetical protein